IYGGCISTGLRGYALDDRKKVARSMADLAQQDTQCIFATLLFRRVNRRGDDALDRSVLRHVSVDPEVEPLFFPLSQYCGHLDFQSSGRSPLKQGMLGGNDEARCLAGEELAVGLADDAPGSPGQ